MKTFFSLVFAAALICIIVFAVKTVRKRDKRSKLGLFLSMIACIVSLFLIPAGPEAIDPDTAGGEPTAWTGSPAVLQEPTELLPAESSPQPAGTPEPSETETPLVTAAPTPSPSPRPAAAPEPASSPDPTPSPTPLPAALPQSGTYVGSVDSNKYHIPSCRYAKAILPKNEIWFDSSAQAQAAGYSACKVCKP